MRCWGRDEKSWTRGDSIELGARSRGGRKERSWTRGTKQSWRDLEPRRKQRRRGATVTTEERVRSL